MNPIIIGIMILSSMVIGLGALWQSSRRQLQTKTQELEGLKKMNNQPFDTKAFFDLQERLTKLEKKLLEIAEKDDREFNTLWAELESLRAEMLTHINNGITLNNWHNLLIERVANIDELKKVLKNLILCDKELAEQLKTTLPAYLINDNLLAGLLDFARLPFDKLNLMELVILPVNAQLESEENKELLMHFKNFLSLTGYDLIFPAIGELYRPDLHEVVEQRLSAYARGTILLVKSRGYLYQGQVLRKAKVAISAGQN
ncbi:MAG: nucleotide exchange factor GrpE [Acidobacteria bacterium]|nr:nucleotide exchange factor GrpE [Acidobacteriota bacterium]